MAIRDDLRRRPASAQRQHRSDVPGNRTPLAEGRFQELLQGASALFAAAERDVVAEKTQTIKEIKALIAHHKISLSDLEE